MKPKATKLDSGILCGWQGPRRTVIYYLPGCTLAGNWNRKHCLDYNPGTPIQDMGVPADGRSIQ